VGQHQDLRLLESVRSLDVVSELVDHHLEDLQEGFVVAEVTRDVLVCDKRYRIRLHLNILWVFSKSLPDIVNDVSLDRVSSLQLHLFFQRGEQVQFLLSEAVSSFAREVILGAFTLLLAE